MPWGMESTELLGGAASHDEVVAVEGQGHALTIECSLADPAMR